MSTILIPFAAGSHYGNRELRLCLESIKLYAKGYDRIVIAGPDPRVNIDGARFIPMKEHYGPKAARIAWKLMDAMDYIDDDDILLWADDYVMLKPFDLNDLKIPHIGALRARAGARRGDYPAALLSTGIALETAGYTSWDYDAHLPMRVSKRAFIELKPWWEKSRAMPWGLLVKSTYGNVLGITAEFVTDCKVYSLADLQAKDPWICSLPDQCNEVINYLSRVIPLPTRSRFPGAFTPDPKAA